MAAPPRPATHAGGGRANAVDLDQGAWRAVSLRLEPGTQAHVRARQLRLGKTHAAPESAGYLLVGITLHFVHPHDRTRSGCERGQGTLEVDGFAAVVRRYPGSAGDAHPEVSRVQGQAQTLPWRTQVHQATRNRDLPQPGPERGLPAKLRQAFVEGHHRVLEQVL